MSKLKQVSVSTDYGNIVADFYQTGIQNSTLLYHHGLYGSKKATMASICKPLQKKQAVI